VLVERETVLPNNSERLRREAEPWPFLGAGETDTDD
jgi:hypothetical protein